MPPLLQSSQYVEDRVAVSDLMARTARTPPDGPAPREAGTGDQLGTPGRRLAATPMLPGTPVRRPAAAFGAPSPPSGASYAGVVELGQRTKGKRQVKAPSWHQGFEVSAGPNRRLLHSPRPSTRVPGETQASASGSGAADQLEMWLQPLRVEW